MIKIRQSVNSKMPMLIHQINQGLVTLHSAFEIKQNQPKQKIKNAKETLYCHVTCCE